MLQNFKWMWTGLTALSALLVLTAYHLSSPPSFGTRHVFDALVTSVTLFLGAYLGTNIARAVSSRDALVSLARTELDTLDTRISELRDACFAYEASTTREHFQRLVVLFASAGRSISRSKSCGVSVERLVEIHLEAKRKATIESYYVQGTVPRSVISAVHALLDNLSLEALARKAQLYSGPFPQKEPTPPF